MATAHAGKHVLVVLQEVVGEPPLPVTLTAWQPPAQPKGCQGHLRVRRKPTSA